MSDDVYSPLFWAPYGEHHVSRGYQEAFVEDVLNPLGFTQYGLPLEPDTIPEGFTVDNHVYTNGVFSILHYWWDDCTCGAGEESAETDTEVECDDTCRLNYPNFIYHPLDFKMHWYKYALRGARSNQFFTIEMLTRFIQEAKKSVKSGQD